MGLFTAKEARELSISANIAGDLEVLSVLQKVKEQSAKGSKCLYIDENCSLGVLDKLGELGYVVSFPFNMNESSIKISW